MLTERLFLRKVPTHISVSPCAFVLGIKKAISVRFPPVLTVVAEGLFYSVWKDTVKASVV
jgi:hypothetical protein